MSKIKKFIKDNKGAPLTVSAVKQLLVKFMELLSSGVGEVYGASSITELSDEMLSGLKVGDCVQKKTGNMKHAYFVTYKEEEHGICLSYFAAGYLETVSYDYTGGHWVYNSTDVVNVSEALTEISSELSSKATVWKTEDDIEELSSDLLNHVKTGDSIYSGITGNTAIVDDVNEYNIYIKYYTDVEVQYITYAFNSIDDVWEFTSSSIKQIGGTKLYKHELYFINTDESVYIISTKETPYVLTDFINVIEIGKDYVSGFESLNGYIAVMIEYDDTNPNNLTIYTTNTTTIYAGFDSDTVTPL